MLLRASPVSRTSLTPLSTSELDPRMSSLISFAALAERWASSLTSCATTANPFPASRPCHLDARVQRQEVRLKRDFIDNADDTRNLIRGGLDAPHGVDGVGDYRG